jgi:hypothetical protein
MSAGARSRSGERGCGIQLLEPTAGSYRAALEISVVEEHGESTLPNLFRHDSSGTMRGLSLA